MAVVTLLTLILLTWKIRWALNNASKWQMEFNSAFKGLNSLSLLVMWCTNRFNIQEFYILPHWICVFCIYLRTNSDLCHLHHKLIGFYNRGEKCLLWGTVWVFKQSSLQFVFKGLIYNSSWEWAQSCSKHVEDSNKHFIEEIVRQVGHQPELYEDTRSE
jgi:hypothetical protein